MFPDNLHETHYYFNILWALAKPLLNVVCHKLSQTLVVQTSPKRLGQLRAATLGSFCNLLSLINNKLYVTAGLHCPRDLLAKVAHVPA